MKSWLIVIHADKPLNEPECESLLDKPETSLLKKGADNSIPWNLPTNSDGWPILPLELDLSLPQLKEILRSFVTITYRELALNLMLNLLPITFYQAIVQTTKEFLFLGNRYMMIPASLSHVIIFLRACSFENPPRCTLKKFTSSLLFSSEDMRLVKKCFGSNMLFHCIKRELQSLTLMMGHQVTRPPTW
jgi:hypothetical protein